MSLQGPSPPTDDEFGDHVGRVLGIGKMADASRILQMRAQFQASAAMGAHAMTAATADELNARNQRFFDAAAKILSRDDFIAVFEFAPGEAIDLVVPNLGP